MSLKTGFFVWLLALVCPFSTLATETSKTVSTAVPENTVQARKKKSLVFGHNLGPTTGTLTQNDWTVGNVFIGVGLTDDLTVGTSPWLYRTYNMNNIFLRTKKPLSNNWEWGFQGGYFKTGEFGENIYQMEALSLWNTFSYQVNRTFLNHLSFNYMYFFDETIPFSLRQEPGTNHAYQFSMSNLFEARLTEKFGMLVEAAILGLDYVNPLPHFGASIFYRLDSWLFQFGTSATIRLKEKFHPSEGARYGNNDITQLHPEIYLQYFF